MVTSYIISQILRASARHNNVLICINFSLKSFSWTLPPALIASCHSSASRPWSCPPLPLPLSFSALLTPLWNHGIAEFNNLGHCSNLIKYFSSLSIAFSSSTFSVSRGSRSNLCLGRRCIFNWWLIIGVDYEILLLLARIARFQLLKHCWLVLSLYPG